MNKKNILVLVIVILAIMVGFWYLAGNGAASSDSSLSANTSNANSTDAQYIYSLLQEMGQVKLDDAIFSNQIFTGLKDNTVSFSPQASGRPNPFAPVGNDGSPISTTSVNIK